MNTEVMEQTELQGPLDNPETWDLKDFPVKWAVTVRRSLECVKTTTCDAKQCMETID